MIGRPAACLLAVGLLLLTAATAAAQTSPSVKGNRLLMSFDPFLNDEKRYPPGNFTVTVAGENRAVTRVSLARPFLSLHLVSEVYAKQTVEVQYVYRSDPRLIDLNGNNIADFGPLTVTNESTKQQPTTTPPPTPPPTPPGGNPPGVPTQSSDASLRELLLSAGTLAFDRATTSYEVEVPHTVESLTVTPTVNHVGATVTVNGTAVASGTASGPIALSEAENAVAVEVTAADGTTRRTYRVTVRRVLGPDEKALVDKVGQALLGRNDPGVNAPEVGSNR